MALSETYRPDIDGLRAIAVLAVVGYHLFPRWIRGGFSGVDIFFVISGYLISKNILGDLQRDQFTFSKFYSRRVRRIFPVLIVVLLFVLIAGWFILMPMDYRLLGKHIAGGAAFTSNFILSNEAGYFDTSSDSKALLHLWSLAVEEQFYLCWPLFLFLLFRKKLNQFKFCTSVVFFSAIFSFLELRHSSKIAFYWPLSRIWELGVGSLLALPNIQQRSQNIPRLLREMLSLIGISLILSGVALLGPTSKILELNMLVPVIGTALIIASGPRAWINRNLLAAYPTVWIGLISYPLYLWHWPLFVFFSQLSEVSHWHHLHKGTILAASFLLAWLSYQLIEKPIRSRSHEGLSTLILTTLLAGLGVFGWIAYRSDGFANSYPETIRNFARPIEFKFESLARFGSCHYDSNSGGNIQVGEPQCVDHLRPLILIWGDSYAASLYPGLHHLQQSRKDSLHFGISQATSCGTPPLLNIEWSNGCAESTRMNRWNNDVLNLISAKKPEIVLMHAFWSEYGEKTWLLQKLRKTIPEIIRLSKSSRIVILGPVPQWGGWRDGLPKTVFKYLRSNGDSTVLPLYIDDGLNKEIETFDQFLAKEVPKLGATYISAYQTLCNAGRCVARIGRLPEELSAIDQGHLSEAGSKFLFERISTSLLKFPVR